VAAQPAADAVDERVVKALGHPTRVRILNVMRDRALASPVELSAELGVPLGTVGYHVRRLESLGFLELARRTQRRGAIEHHYRVRRLLDDAEAEEAGTSRSPDGLGAEALAVARVARAALARGGFDDLAARADRRVLLLDARGEAELSRALRRWDTTATRVARASAARLARSGQPPAHRCVAVLMRVGAPDDPAAG